MKFKHYKDKSKHKKNSSRLKNKRESHNIEGTLYTVKTKWYISKEKESNMINEKVDGDAPSLTNDKDVQNEHSGIETEWAECSYNGRKTNPKGEKYK